MGTLDTLRSIIPGMGRKAETLAVEDLPAMKLGHTGGVIQAERDLQAMDRFNMSPRLAKPAEPLLIPEPVNPTEAFQYGAAKPAPVPAPGATPDPFAPTPIPLYGPHPEADLLATPAAKRQSGFPNAYKTWQARNIVHKLKMREVFEDGNFGDKLLTAATKPGATATDLTDVLFSTPNDHAVIHVYRGATNSTLERTEALLGKVDRDTLAEALALFPNQAAADSLARVNQLHPKALLQATMRYSYARQLTNACNVVDKAGVASLNPKKIFEYLGNGLKGEKAIYGSQELRAMEILGPETVTELRKLARYMETYNYAPAGSTGHNVMSFRMVSNVLSLISGVGGFVTAPFDSNNPNAVSEASWRAAKTFLLVGAVNFGFAGHQAKFLSNPKSLAKLNLLLEQINDPKLAMMNSAKIGARFGQAFAALVDNDAPGRLRRKQQRSASRGPSLTTEQGPTPAPRVSSQPPAPSQPRLQSNQQQPPRTLP